MTDKEIIKALACCGSLGEYHCHDKCPRLNNGIAATSYCRRDLIISAHDLIKRQQAEIERLKEIANPKCQQCVEQTRKNSFIEFAEEFEKRCIEGGIYPAFVKSTLNAVKEELTEGSNNCTDCKYFVSCESPKQMFHTSSGIKCDEFERGKDDENN